MPPPHEHSLIAIIAIGFSAAFVCGLIAAKLRLSPIVGYLVAGVIVGPFTPGFVGDQHLANQLSEIGILLLMFGVGLHFSLEDLNSVKRIAVPGALLQIGGTVVLGTVTGMMFGWSMLGSAIFGLALSVASTVVLIRALEDRDELHSTNGKIAVGWLIVEDLIVVLSLVLLPALGAATSSTQQFDWVSLTQTIAIAIGKVIVFAGLMIVFGKRLLPKLLEIVARTNSRELFTLSIFAVAMGVAFASASLFGISLALGAFFAGMMIKESELSKRVAEKALPLQDAFAVLFFVSVGMLFDPNVLKTHWPELIAVVAIITVGKSIIAFGTVMAFRYPLDTGVMVSVSLAQIGEFSFILAGLGLAFKIIPPVAYSLILAGAIFSISLNPLIFKLVDPAIEHLSKLKVFSGQKHQEGRRQLDNNIILVGFGKVGRHIFKHLADSKANLLVIDKNRDRVREMEEMGVNAVTGDATHEEFLRDIQIEKAHSLIIAIPIAFEARQILEAARRVNPNITVVVRAVSDEEYDYYIKHDVDLCVMGERETAKKMSEFVLAPVGGGH